MGCCYSEPDGSDCGLAQIDTATAYHEIKPTVIPTYTNTIRKPSVRLPPVAEEVFVGQALAKAPAPSALAQTATSRPSPLPSAPTPQPSPIMRAEESFGRPVSDLDSLISPIRAPIQVQPLKKKKGKK